jgi:hypothetical protein
MRVPCFTTLSDRRRYLAVLLALVGFVPLVHGQRREPPAEVVAVHCGWNGIMPADHWSPVRVDVRAGPEPFEGLLVLEHEQDASQRVRVEMAIATTPGRTTTYELAACPRAPGTPLRLSLFGPGVRQTIDLSPGRNSPGFSTPEILAGPYLIAVVGSTSAKSAFAGNAVGPAPATSPQAVAPLQRAALWDNLAPTFLSGTNLPLGWRCYESVNAVVASVLDLTQADARARAALMTWVESGGRLVLVVDANAGDRWRDFIGSAYLDIGAPAILDPVGMWAGEDRRGLRARPLRLTEAARRDGWRMRWPVEGEGEPGLWACGPLGAGMVAVLGIDPDRVPALVRTGDTRNLWRLVLAHPQDGVLPSHLHRTPSDGAAWGWYPGPDWTRPQAITTALNIIVPSVRTAGDSAFLVIVLLVVLLAVLLGPLDRVWLRGRRWERWQWASALGWIGLTTILAYAGPLIVRTNESHAARLRVIDVVDDGRVRVAWATSLTGVFAAVPQSVSYTTSPGGWWRGVSALSPWERPRVGMPVPIRIHSTDVREARVSHVPQGQWTFRTLMEESPLALEPPDVPRVRVRRAASVLTIEVDGLPPGAQPSRVIVNRGDSIASVTLLPLDTENGRPIWIGHARDWTDAARYRRSDGVSMEPSVVWGVPGTQAEALLDLPGVRERSDALRVRLDGERWVLVYLRIDGLEDGNLPRAEGASGRSVLLLREAVMVEDDE